MAYITEKRIRGFPASRKFDGKKYDLLDEVFTTRKSAENMVKVGKGQGKVSTRIVKVKDPRGRGSLYLLYFRY